MPGAVVDTEVYFNGDIHVSATSDALFSSSKLQLAVDDTLLVASSNLVLHRRHCYGLIGENGTGKTTLLRAIHSRILDHTDANLEIAYVGQNDAERESASSSTVLEHCMTGNQRIYRLQQEMAYLEGETCELPVDEAAVRLGLVMDSLEALDVDAAPGKAKEVLRSLGFQRSQIDKPVGSLSGGWRSRLEIARALAGKPDVLMLDEPTNHLDLEATLLLAGLLRDLTAAGQTSIVVSHDAAFMDLICTDIISLHRQTLQTIPGNYAVFEEKAQQYRTFHENLYEKRSKEEARQKSSVAKQKVAARQKGNDKALKQAASRERKAEERTGYYREDGKRFRLHTLKTMDESALRLPARAQPVTVGHQLTLKLPEAPTSRYSQDVPLLWTEGASVGYSQGPDILQNVSVNISAGEKIALVGRNGCGKSTLMNFLMQKGSLTVRKGKVERRGSVALLDQNQLAHLDQFGHMTPVSYLTQRHSAEFQTPQSIREYLGRFGLGGDELPLLPIESLSGGLRVRLALADLFATSPPDILLLDEPTNHLDAETITAFGNALREYAGACIIVSHNAGFLLGLCTQLWVCRPVDRSKVRTPPCDVTVQRGDFAEHFRSFAEAIVPPKDRAGLSEMLKVRAMRQAVVVQQAGASTSLLIAL